MTHILGVSNNSGLEILHKENDFLSSAQAANAALSLQNRRDLSPQTKRAILKTLDSYIELMDTEAKFFDKAHLLNNLSEAFKKMIEETKSNINNAKGKFQEAKEVLQHKGLSKDDRGKFMDKFVEANSFILKAITNAGSLSSLSRTPEQDMLATAGKLALQSTSELSTKNMLSFSKTTIALGGYSLSPSNITKTN